MNATLFLDDTLKRFKLASLYKTKIRHYTLHKHTELVLKQYEKYFSELHTVEESKFFRYFFIFHDIGKAQAHKTGNRRLQHHFSCEMLNEMKPELPFTNSEFKTALALLESDPLGVFFKSGTDIKRCVESVLKQTKKTDLSAAEFFYILTVYYQCDTGSYTKDAGGLAYLEHLFEYKDGIKVLHEKEKRICFSFKNELKYITLKSKISE